MTTAELLDYFAGQALGGLIKRHLDWTLEDISKEAYRYAAEMMDVRDKLPDSIEI